MTFYARLATVAVALSITACASNPPPPPPPITAEQFAAYKLTEVVINTDDANVVWPAAERDFAKAQGVPEPRQSSFGNPDDAPDDREAEQIVAYQDVTTSDEALAYYRERARDVVTPRMEQAIAPSFTGETPLRMTVDVGIFQIRSSGAVALGGSEGTSGVISFQEVKDDVPVAESPRLQFVSGNGAVGYGGGSLAGLAIGLAVTAAINVTSDAFIDSHENISKNYANVARSWLQLEPHVFPEDQAQ